LIEVSNNILLDIVEPKEIRAQKRNVLKKVIENPTNRIPLKDF